MFKNYRENLKMLKYNLRKICYRRVGTSVIIGVRLLVEYLYTEKQVITK